MVLYLKKPRRKNRTGTNEMKYAAVKWHQKTWRFNVFLSLHPLFQTLCCAKPSLVVNLCVWQPTVATVCTVVLRSTGKEPITYLSLCKARENQYPAYLIIKNSPSYIRLCLSRLLNGSCVTFSHLCVSDHLTLFAVQAVELGWRTGSALNKTGYVGGKAAVSYMFTGL